MDLVSNNPMDVSAISIGSRRIGLGEGVFIIAEIGVNHNGDVDLAKQLIDKAAEAGVDAVKFQTFKAEQIASAKAPKADYQLQTTDPTESQHEMLRRLELPYDAHQELQGHSEKRGVRFLSTPFHEEGVDMLLALGMSAIKVGSGEITNLPFLRHVARKKRPIILSTGMSYLSEVDQAVRVIHEEGNDQLILLHCTSNYPADPDDVNLRAMQTMGRAFRFPVGYSDHTAGIEVVLAAVALGACVIEKHFTLDRNLPGPDHRASLEPEELMAMVRGVRIIERALGRYDKAPSPSELPMRSLVRRSLTALQNIPAGVRIAQNMIGIRRPGTGIEPGCLSQVLGRVATRAIEADEPITWDHLLTGSTVTSTMCSESLTRR